MQIGVLALVCLGILAITGVSENFEKRFSVSRFSLFMLCFSAVILNTLSVKVVPEFILNPASLFLIFVMLLGSFERGEKGFSVAVFAIILIAAAQIALSQYVGGELWGLIGIILPIALTEKRTFVSLLCVCIAPLLAYGATVLLEVLGVISLYLSEADVFNAQIIGMICVGVSAYLASAFGKDGKLVLEKNRM